MKASEQAKAKAKASAEAAEVAEAEAAKRVTRSGTPVKPPKR